MAREIARRLANDGVTWETVVVEEDQGGGGAHPINVAALQLSHAQILASNVSPASKLPVRTPMTMRCSYGSA